MKLGRAIKIARARQGLKQVELANRLEVSANYISLLENDRRDPSWTFVCNLADALDVPLPLLLLLAEEKDALNINAASARSAIAQELLALVAAGRA